MLQAESEDILRTFYKLLFDQVILSEKKLKNDSVLWTLVLCIEKKRSSIMDSSAQSKILFDHILIEELIENGLIVFNSVKKDSDYYNLTPKGIWYIEKLDRGFKDENLIEFITSKHFDFKKKGKPINDKDKLALFTMIGVRNFSKNLKMDLNDTRDCNEWNKIFEISFNFLNTSRYFGKEYMSFDDLVNKSSEHAIINLMRHTYELPIKSDHIFQNPGGKLGKTYWLDIYINDSFSGAKFNHLIYLIFGKIENFSRIKEIYDQLNLIAHNYAKLVIKDFSFIKADFDDLVYESLKNFFLKE